MIRVSCWTSNVIVYPDVMVMFPDNEIQGVPNICVNGCGIQRWSMVHGYVKKKRPVAIQFIYIRPVFLFGTYPRCEPVITAFKMGRPSHKLIHCPGLVERRHKP